MRVGFGAPVLEQALARVAPRVLGQVLWAVLGRITEQRAVTLHDPRGVAFEPAGERPLFELRDQPALFAVEAGRKAQRLGRNVVFRGQRRGPRGAAREGLGDRGLNDGRRLQ